MNHRLTMCIVAAAMLAPQLRAQDNAAPKFRRSSIYSVMLHSKAADARLDNDGETGNLLTDALRNRQADDTISKSAMLLQLYPSLPVPTQFDDINLNQRIIEFDDMTITDAEVQAATPAGGKKKGGKLGGLAKGLAKNALGTAVGLPAQPGTDDVTNKAAAAAIKFFAENNIAAELVAKWYGYNPQSGGSTPYNLDLISQRGLYSASAEDKAAAAATLKGNRALMDDGEKLVGNTYVIVNYLRCRSNASIVKEIQTYTDAVAAQAGSMGMLASQALGAAAGAIAGNGFSVQTYSYLFRLKWDEDIQNAFYTKYWDKSKEELVASGLCQLEYIGYEKSRARVREGIGTRTSSTELLRQAAIRSIDESIAELQVKHEAFRTLAPIVKVDKGEGLLYASIGLKEGIEAGDEYEILSPVEDPSTKVVTYKSVGKVKAVEGQITDNREGATDYLAEDLQSDDPKVKAAAEAAQGVQFTAFKGKVKEEYAGMLLRLSKKK